MVSASTLHSCSLVISGLECMLMLHHTTRNRFWLLPLFSFKPLSRLYESSLRELMLHLATVLAGLCMWPCPHLLVTWNINGKQPHLIFYKTHSCVADTFFPLYTKENNKDLLQEWGCAWSSIKQGTTRGATSQLKISQQKLSSSLHADTLSAAARPLLQAPTSKHFSTLLFNHMHILFSLSHYLLAPFQTSILLFSEESSHPTQ